MLDLFTTNSRVFTRNLFKHALFAMLWGCTPTLWARYLYYGAHVKVLSCHLPILPNLLVVRTLILASWVPLLRVLLHVFTK
jgi:hypothetical protein